MSEYDWLATASASTIRTCRDVWRMSGSMMIGDVLYPRPYPCDFDKLIAAAEAREAVANAAANAVALTEELTEREAMYAWT